MERFQSNPPNTLPGFHPAFYHHRRTLIRLSVLWVVLTMLLLQQGSAQPRKSRSFRTSDPGPSALIIESDPSAQLLEGFMLIQKANAGDPVAEQEVGLRYLFGRDFPPDTAKAAFWIRKAAEQSLLTAQYNLAILTNNGWGVRWDPFAAFRLFLEAAKRKMMEAQYMVGLTYVDDLVLPRNWDEAYSFLSASAAQGFKPAKQVLDEFAKRGIHVTPDSTGSPAQRVDSARTTDRGRGKPDTAWTPVFLDLQRDPPTAVNDTTLLKEAYHEANVTSQYAFDEQHPDKHDAQSDTGMVRIRAAAESGNPESLTLLGRLYEEGIGVEHNVVLGAEYYIRAIRFDSPRASLLLWKLVQTEDFRKQLDERSKRNDPVALFVWAGVTALHYDNTLNDQQALELLQKSAGMHHVPALIELGLCSYQGRWVERNRDAALALWREAASLGSMEATVRIAAAEVTGDFADHRFVVNLPILFDAAKEGVLLAQLALAYCYEHGIGLPENKGQAAELYRVCAQRGSQNAFQSLRRMYDQIRPKGKEFVMED